MRLTKSGLDANTDPQPPEHHRLHEWVRSVGTIQPALDGGSGYSKAEVDVNFGQLQHLVAVTEHLVESLTINRLEIVQNVF